MHLARALRPLVALTLALAPGVVLLTPSAADAQARSFLIRDFHVDAEIRSDGVVAIAEHIELEFSGSWNGIYRTIPVRYQTPRGFGYRLDLRLLSITGPDGSPLEFQPHRSGNDLDIQIWIPGAQNAVRTIVLRYEARRALRFDDEMDELYWNATGTEWDVPIRNASALVRLPPGAEGIRTTVATGGYGSRDRSARVEERPAEGTVYFETTRELDYREGLTFAVAWNPGVVDRPGLVGNVFFFLRSNWPFALPILSLVGMWWLWWHRGRDPERGSIVAEYEPPLDLGPAEVGTLVDHRPDVHDIVAALVDLAVRGHLRIEQEKTTRLMGLITDEDYTLVRLTDREEWDKLRLHEQDILKGVFGGGLKSSVKLSDLESSFYHKIPGIRSDIFSGLVLRKFYRKRPDKVAQHFFAMGGATLVLGFIGATLLADRGMVLPAPAIIAALLTPLPIFAFAAFMPARTEKGVEALRRILGFQEFLGRVESDRYRRMITSPEQFEKYLPYAMALGVEKKWAAAFDGLVKEPPNWYVGSDPMGFRPTRFVGSMGGFSTRAGSALTSAPRSSGGSGFSGGGGGGGGGFSGGGMGGGGGRGF